MVKVDTDGSGFGNVIIGCPGCDIKETWQMRYNNCQWWIDPERDQGRHSFRILYCPFCGIKLPFLDGWVLSQNDGTDTAKD
jgi:hypothetical protein